MTSAELPEGVRVRSVRQDDRARWGELYEGYLTFYKTALTAGQLDLVWSWLMDDSHEVCGLVAVGPAGVIGLAHYRQFTRPSSASLGGYLDDLFVDPAVRGSGTVEALLGALSDIGRQKNWAVIRWIMADDNYRARAKYDQHARRTSWITYDLTPGSALE